MPFSATQTTAVVLVSLIVFTTALASLSPPSSARPADITVPILSSAPKSPESYFLSPLLSKLYNQSFLAFQETERPEHGNDYWFWTGDNAKVLLLLLRDYENYKTITDGLEVFMEGMYHDFLFFRKQADMNFYVINGDARNFSISNHFITFYGNLAIGRIAFTYEGYIGSRTVFNGSFVTYDGETYRVLDHMSGFDLAVGPEVLVFTINYADPNGVSGTIKYTVRNDSPFIDATFTLKNEGDRPINNVRLGIVLDELDGANTYDHFFSPAVGNVPFGSAPQHFGKPAEGDWWIIYRRSSLYESEGMWMFSPESSKVVDVYNEGASGRASRFTVEYEASDILPRGEEVAVEQRMLFLRAVDWVDIDKYDFTSVDLTNTDPSFDYDWGLNSYALAEYYRTTGTRGKEIGRIVENFYRIAMNALSVHCRSIAFHIEAALTMYDVTGDAAYLMMAEDMGNLIIEKYIGINPQGEKIAMLHSTGEGCGYTDLQSEVAKAFYRLYQSSNNPNYLNWAYDIFGALHVNETSGKVYIMQVLGDTVHSDWSMHDGYILDAGALVSPFSEVTLRVLSNILSISYEDGVIPTKRGSRLNSEAHPYAALALLRYGDCLTNLLGNEVVFKRLISANITGVKAETSSSALIVNLESSSNEGSLELICPNAPRFMLNSRSSEYDLESGLLKLTADLPKSISVSFDPRIPVSLIKMLGTITGANWIQLGDGRPPYLELITDDQSMVTMYSPLYRPEEVLGAGEVDWAFDPISKILEIVLEPGKCRIRFQGYYLTLKNVDQTGKQLPFAQVEVYSSTGQLSVKAATDELGDLTLFLPPGNYIIRSSWQTATYEMGVNLKEDKTVFLELYISGPTEPPPTVPAPTPPSILYLAQLLALILVALLLVLVLKRQMRPRFSTGDQKRLEISKVSLSGNSHQ